MNEHARALAKIRHDRMTKEEKVEHTKFLTKIGKMPKKKRKKKVEYAEQWGAY